MKVLKNTVFQRMLLISLFILLLMSYWRNSFKLVEEGWFSSWQTDSEWSVWDRIYDDVNYGFTYHAGLLGDCRSDATYTYDPDHGVYTAQMGLQGFIFGLLFKYLHLSKSQLYFITVLVLIICFMALAWWVWDEFGYGVAVGYTVLLFFNNWLTVAARNLYQVIFTLIFPFLCTLFILRYAEKTGKNVKYVLLVFGFLSVFLRCACGYEYISVAMINLELPVFYYAVKNRWKIKYFLKSFFGLAIVAMMAFASSIGIVIIQIRSYRDSDIATAFHAFLWHVLYRTGIGDMEQYEGLIRKSLEASRLAILHTYLDEGRPLLFGFRMEFLIVLVIVAVLICFMDSKYCKEIGEKRKKMLSLAVLVCLAFLGPLSWFFLAKGHSYIHTHIIYMVWSLPFLLLGEILFFYSVGTLAVSLGKRHRKASVGVVALTVLLCLAGYYDLHLPVIKEYERAVSLGEEVYSDGIDTVVYYEKAFYYLNDEEDSSRHYFLHFYEDESSGEFHNCDFIFSNREAKFPFWKKRHMVKIEMPKDYSVQKIETGLVGNDSSEGLWKISLGADFLGAVGASFEIVDISDDNWNHGFSKHSKMILAYGENAYLGRCVGRSLEINGETAVITNTKYVDETYFYVYIDKNITNQSAGSMATLVD